MASIVESALAHAWAIVGVRKGVDGLSPAIGLGRGQDGRLRLTLSAFGLTFFVWRTLLAIVLLFVIEHFVEAARIYLLVSLGGGNSLLGLRLQKVAHVRVFRVELLLELGDSGHRGISRLARLFLYKNDN